MVAQAIRCVRFSRVTKSGFLAAKISHKACIDINIIHFPLNLYICKIPKRVFLQTENTQIKSCILSGSLPSVKVNYLQTKKYNIFLKITT